MHARSMSKAHFPPQNTHVHAHVQGYHAPQEKSLSAQRFVLVTRPQWHVASCKIFGQGGQAPGIQASTSNRQWMGTQKEETEGGREKREEGHTYTSTDKHRHTHTHAHTHAHNRNPTWMAQQMAGVAAVWPEAASTRLTTRVWRTPRIKGRVTNLAAEAQV